MSTTLTGIRRHMLDRTVDKELLGQAETITGLAAQTVTVGQLATGGGAAQSYALQWLLRADNAAAASADRLRRCTDFATATGVFTHAGTAYADTTITGETLEIWKYHPRAADLAIRLAQSRIKRLHRYVYPTVANETRYYLHPMSWVAKNSDIERVAYCPSPVLNRNRHFEHWNTVSTGGVLQPDEWTLAGADATMARNATTVRRGQYSVAITRAGTDATLSQTVGLLETGVSADSLRSVSVTAVAVVNASVASQVRVQWLDGTQTISSSYHTGGGTWEELSTTVTVTAATASTLTLRISVEGSNTVCYVDECYIVAEQGLSDAVRRDTYDESNLTRDDYFFDQSTKSITLPAQGRGGQYVFYTRRPYPQFDEARVRAGTADADVSDVPMELCAVGAIARMFEGMAQTDSKDRARYGQLAAEWDVRFETMALAHYDQAVTGGNNHGWPLPIGRRLAPVARR